MRSDSPIPGHLPATSSRGSRARTADFETMDRSRLHPAKAASVHASTWFRTARRSSDGRDSRRGIGHRILHSQLIPHHIEVSQEIIVFTDETPRVGGSQLKSRYSGDHAASYPEYSPSVLVYSIVQVPRGSYRGIRLYTTRHASATCRVKYTQCYAEPRYRLGTEP